VCVSPDGVVIEAVEAMSVDGGGSDVGEGCGHPPNVADPIGSLEPDAAVEEFALKWGLDDACRSALGALPAALRAKVLAEFAPEGDVKNMRALFMSFLRRHDPTLGRQSRGGRAASAPRERGGVWQPKGAPRVHEAKRQSKTGRIGGAIRGPAIGAAVRPVASSKPKSSVENPGAPPGLQRASGPELAGLDDVETFLKRWNLDETSGALVRELPATLQRTVFIGFEPAPNTRDVNARLQAFVRSKIASQPSVNAGLPQSGEAYDGIGRFVRDWSLGWRSEELLRSLPRSQVRSVLRDFAPEAGADPDRKLAGFVRRVASGANQYGGDYGGGWSDSWDTWNTWDSWEGGGRGSTDWGSTWYSGWEEDWYYDSTPIGAPPSAAAGAARSTKRASSAPPTRGGSRSRSEGVDAENVRAAGRKGAGRGAVAAKSKGAARGRSSRPGLAIGSAPAPRRAPPGLAKAEVL